MNNICHYGNREIYARVINAVNFATLSPPSGSYSSPLMTAVAGENIDIVDDLLVRGCDVNFVNAGGKNILIDLLHKIHINSGIKYDITHRLIKYGINVNFNYRGYTSIYYANDVNILNLLLLNGANINVNMDGLRGRETLLFYAIQAYRDDLVSAILSFGPYLQIDKITELINNESYYNPPLNGSMRTDSPVINPYYFFNRRLTNEDKRVLLNRSILRIKFDLQNYYQPFVFVERDLS